MSKQRGVLWVPRSFIIFISVILLIASILLSGFHDESISILINVNLVIISSLFVLTFYRAKISGILYFVYACIMMAYFHSYSFFVVIPMTFILISGILLYVLPEEPKTRDISESLPKRNLSKLKVPKWMKQGIAWLLLFCILFLFLVHLTVKIDQKRPNEIMFPKHWNLYSMLFLEEPNITLYHMKVKFRRYYPPLYQGSSSKFLSSEIKAYLDKRNAYIRSFEKQFVDPADVKSDTPFREPYQKIQHITEFLPVKEGKQEGVILITRAWENNIPEEDFSDIYYLDSTFHLLDHITLSSHHGDTSAYVSAKFMDRIWLPTFSMDNSDPKRLTNSTISRHLIAIQVNNGKIVTKECEGKYLYAFSDEEVIASNFDEYRFVNISTNPTLTIYKEANVKKLLIHIKGFTNSIARILSPLRPAFPYLILLILIILLLFYHKKTTNYLRNLMKKQDNI